MDDINKQDEEIARLEQILEKEKLEEDNDNIEDDEEIQSIIQKYNEELQSLENEKEKLKSQLNEKKEDNKIIDIFKNGINNDIIKYIQEKIIDEIISKLNKYFEEYEKKMEEKIKQMKKDINELSQDIIQKQFDTVLCEIKQNNEKIINECINKQNLIKENIDKIKLELQINNENIKKINNKDNNIEIEDKEYNLNNMQNSNKNKKLSDKNMNKDNYKITPKNSGEINISKKNSKKNMDKLINKKNSIKDNNQINIKKIRGEIIDNDNDISREISNEYNNNNMQKGPIDRKSKKYFYNIVDDDDGNIQEFPEDSNNGEVDLHINSINKTNNFFRTNVNNLKNLKNNNNNYNTKFWSHELNTKIQPTKVKFNSNNISNTNQGNNIINKNKDIQQLNPKTDIVNKQINRKIYTSVNNVFFQDYQQKYIKVQKIIDVEKEELERVLIKEKLANQHTLRDYCINYIEKIVLPLFKRKDIIDEEREIIKYNLEIVLQCCGLDKNTYYNYYYPERNNKQKTVDRLKSVDALRRFRKEFGISEKDYKDEGLIPKLVENEYDIYKTFQKIFG